MRITVLLLDSPAATVASADGPLVLRTAVAAATEQMAPIGRILYGGDSYSPPTKSLPSLSAQSAFAAVPGGTGGMESSDATPHLSSLIPGNGMPEDCIIAGRELVAAAVVAAVDGVMGTVPETRDPLMGAGLTSEGAVRLTAALETALGRDLPGDEAVFETS